MSFGEIAAYALAAVLGLFLCGLFFKPLKGIFLMILQSGLGGAGLFVCNLLLSKVGLAVGVNIVSAAVCGLFGLPGLVLLILVKGIFTYM